MPILLYLPLLLSTAYFLARILTAHPFIPPPPSSSFPRFSVLITALFIPLLLLLPHLLLTSTANRLYLLLSYIPPACLSLRHSLTAPHISSHHPYTLLSYPRLLLWRVDIALYLLALPFVLILQRATWLPLIITIASATVTTAIFFVHVHLLSTARVHTLSDLFASAFQPSHPPRVPETAPPTVRQASALSLLAFNWVTNTVVTGRQRPLESTDVIPLAPRFNCETSAARYLSPAWRAQLQRSRPSLLRALFNAFGLRLMLGGFLKLISDVFLFVSPMLLKSIISHLQSRREAQASSAKGILLACAMFGSYFAQLLVFNQYFNIMATMQALLRGSLVSAVFEKSCRLSPESRSLYTSGQIQNLMSNDSRTVADIVLYVHMVWSSAEQIVVAMLLLVQLLGWAPTFAGILFIISSMFVQSKLVGTIKNQRERASARTDERVKLVAEAIKGIKLVKLYAWELSFVKRILDVRAKELDLLRSISFLQATNSMLVTSIPTVLTIIAFSIYALNTGSLDAAVVFPSIALFNVIRPSLMFLPNILISTARAGASLSRLSDFLATEELTSLDQGDHAINQQLLELNKIDLASANAAFTWDPSISRACPTLSDVTFWIPQGKLVAVIGPTGSGKSTLLAGLLGEVPIIEGEAGIRKGRSISFCDQIPFIQNATVRENILFGKPFDGELYRTTIRVCNLLSDLKILPAGDLTEIGGRGVNLSGGQRSRVALARAVYSRADICFLDDPLSAVDAHVGKSIFQNCIASQLQGTTRVLTTNQIHYAASPEVDMVIVVKNGTVVEAGFRDELLSQDSEFSRMLKSTGEIGAAGASSRSDRDPNTDNSGFEHTQTLLREDAEIQKTIMAAEEKVSQVNESTPIAGTDGQKGYGAVQVGRLTEKETKQKGRVELAHYKTYLSGMGLKMWVPSIILCAIGAQIASLSVNVWLSDWSDQKDEQSTFFRLAVFLAFGLATVFVAGVSSFSLAFGSIRASVLLHEKLLLSVFGAPSSFFNSTPEGRLVNRFNSDIDKIDSSLSSTMQSLLRLTLNLAFTVGLILWVTPAFIFVVIPIAAMCLYVQEFYRKSSVDLRRLEALARSPLYSHFSETLDGVVTIRAFGDVPRTASINNKYTDELVTTTYASTFANRWLSIRLEGLGTILIFGATLLAVLTPADRTSAAMIGLVLSYTMQILGSMTWSVRQFTETESQLNAVERVAEYSNPPFPQEEKGGLEQFLKEKMGDRSTLSDNESTGLISKETAISLSQGLSQRKSRWPRKGRIVFQAVEMKYRDDLDPALKDVSFTVEPGEHVGIVGRTGAGKSSAIQSLFRLYELNKGQILIDGTSISSLRLFDLRSALGIIPQEPICFSGTIRSNLDMFKEHSDKEIQRALDACGLQDTMRNRVGLDFEIAENGSNLSVGQRQLLCLGRALLKDSQVLILDEATSSVSNATDEKIQATLRNEMEHCTILTVAHRLHTVMRHDKIIVMDRGRVAEIGSPSELLRRPSRFGDLVDETGPATASHLRYLASLPRRGGNNTASVDSGNVPTTNLGENDNLSVKLSTLPENGKSLRENVRAAFVQLRSALTEYQTDAWRDELILSRVEESEWKDYLQSLVFKLTVLADRLSTEGSSALRESDLSFGTGIPARSVDFLAEAIQEGDSRVEIPLRSERASPENSSSLPEMFSTKKSNQRSHEVTAYHNF
ncbi:Multidrug resistance-associated protein 1 [Gracilariopsis chorda]|uniref:Probable ATP-dependent transporter ycf16 n=1 Tax=Gracilariopsis chorda TaxID=448386 RepID=A0A2V3IMX8_9FLOR|nr:Multidrug resistance-associated protein 1 [Gracilariopsis chorda]|eukprot:PXF43436.1 Multidrug resistance-associated protein 1 [Gracilariopsis chorda]